MSCREYRGAIIEAARSESVDLPRNHLETCPKCAEFARQQFALARVLGTFAGETAPDWVEARVLREFDLVKRARTRRRAMAWVGVPAFGLAAMLVVLLWPHPRPSPKPAQVIAHKLDPVPKSSPAVEQHATAPRMRHAAAPLAAVVEDPFVAIPYTLPLAPDERVEVRRLDLPVAELNAAGLRVPAADPGGFVRADVVVGYDGRARAVRLVSISERSMNDE